MELINDPNQGQLIEPFEGVISPMGRKRIAEGWQGMCREIALQLIPVATDKRYGFVLIVGDKATDRRSDQ